MSGIQVLRFFPLRGKFADVNYMYLHVQRIMIATLEDAAASTTYRFSPKIKVSILAFRELQEER